jgi:hypothetical protein
MRRFAAILFATYPLTCFAFELKLDCNVRSAYIFPSGRVENNAGKALVEISEYGNNRIILVSSAIEVVNEQSVTTFPSKDRLISDFSDPNKWHIRNTISGGNAKSTTTIIIDRNSGMLIIDRKFEQNGATVATQISGSCEKIDPTRKKF